MGNTISCCNFSSPKLHRNAHSQLESYCPKSAISCEDMGCDRKNIDGKKDRFAHWPFVHRARLNCIPLNGAIHHENRDKRCRKCGYANDTLPHVLCGCKQHSQAWRHCHNAIQNRLAKAIPPSLGKITLDTAIPGTDSRLRPDIVMTDAEKKKDLLVDIMVPFKNWSPAFHEA
ncbi:hypothetical protein KIL84_017391 [Mauremys mutica]|uniref:Uncharacterized protein n=1 Tax=Mauremys mutica TaxID=74926 RepID=A0A9D3X670_9SAUR|nr:hypothetical protein KIL84_017391 [Mauremys mutica]